MKETDLPIFDNEVYKDKTGWTGRMAKRFFDVASAVASLLVFSPVFIVIYIAIKWKDRGPAIFKQERVGYKGRPFTLYKFRSMVPCAEGEDTANGNSGTPRLFKENDSRLTPVGRFLRDHHLDELPQLWNVLRGDMSFVGPRPERQFFIDKIMERDSRYKYLYQLRPGLFSNATLYNGYTFTMEKMLTRLQMDLEYLQSHTLWGDFCIILKTSASIVTGKKF